MSLELYLVYVGVTLAILVTPGPNGLLCINHAVRFGPRKTFWTSLGSVTGISVLIAASMAGLGALLVASETLFTVVKWVGAAYLLWLAYEMWSAAPPKPECTPADRGTAPRRRRLVAIGFGVAVSNPKALIFYATFFPQFIQTSEPLLGQFAVLAGTSAVLQLAYEVALAFTARGMGNWLVQHGRAFNRVTSATFVGIAGMVAASERGK